MNFSLTTFMQIYVQHTVLTPKTFKKIYILGVLGLTKFVEFSVRKKFELKIIFLNESNSKFPLQKCCFEEIELFKSRTPKNFNI